MTRAVVVHPDADSLVRASAARLALAILDAQSVRPEVHVALTGGRIGTQLTLAFAAGDLTRSIDPSGLHLWWGDERFAPTGHSDRNDTAVAHALRSLVPAANLHPVSGPDRVDTVQASANAYAEELARLGAGSAAPRFDVVLLGVGPDGHVASLFPGHPALEAPGTTVAVTDSPKPPPQRVSLTRGAIDGARQVWLLGSGQEKAGAVAAALGGADLPCARVHGESTLWLLDLDAAGKV